MHIDNSFKTAALKHQPNAARPGSAAETVLGKREFAEASAEISSWPGYQPSPLVALDGLAAMLGLDGIHYKDEGMRFGLGSFKALGGAYAGLRVLQRQLEQNLGRKVSLAEIRNGELGADVSNITLVSATDGNHGRSLAWGASKFGAPCRIYIHQDVSEGRANSIRELGAEVIRVDGDYDHSVHIARQEADQNGWFVVSDTSWDGYTQAPTDVMAGYGIMIDEIAEQMQDAPTHLFVQGGVGGLAASMVARLRQVYGNNARIVVVEPELAACLFESAKAGSATTVAIQQETLMAGLSCGEPSALAWDVLKDEVSDFLTIPETLVAPSMRLLAYPVGNDDKIVAGESAICGLAGLIAACQHAELKQALGLTEHSKVLLIGSEGATDPKIYKQLVEGN